MAKLAGLEYVRRVVVFDEQGNVIASTNMKFKGQTLQDVFPDVDLGRQDRRPSHPGADPGANRVAEVPTMELAYAS